MDDHDQRFKTLLQQFFPAFFELFFPDWAKRFNFDTVEWLTQDVFPDPPQGKFYSVDLLAKLAVREPVRPMPGGQEEWLALVHVEVESPDKVAPLWPRMFHFYENLRRLYRLPVLPIGLYLRVGLDGIGWDVYEESFWDEPLLRFRYAYVGLPGLDGERYLHGDNWLGVALMRVPPERRLELAEEAWRRLVKCPENEFRRRLLCECVGAYAPLDEEQRKAFAGELLKDPDPGARTMAMGVFEQFHKQGLEKGLVQGQRKTLRLMLAGRFGPLSETALARLEAMTAEQLESLAVAFLKATSLQDLGLTD